jgi:hypothetical protein
MLEIDEDCEEDDAETEYSEDSPEKKTIKSASKKDNEENKGIEKWEKNVKRRVYDALNVLYAAGVLRKDGKYVSCNPNACDINSSSSEFSAIEQDYPNAYDQISKRS